MADNVPKVDVKVTVEEAPKVERKPYRLRAGKKHTHNGRAVQPGEVVELTKQQAMAFRDKFEGAPGFEAPQPVPESGPTVFAPAKGVDGSKGVTPPTSTAPVGGPPAAQDPTSPQK